jgi:hypothetical protein
MAADDTADTASTSGASPSTEGSSGAPAAADALPLDTLAAAADPALVSTIFVGAVGDMTDAGAALDVDAMHYDAHVALTLDTDALPAMDSLLDLLVTSHDLFDIPAIDAVSPLDDATST